MVAMHVLDTLHDVRLQLLSDPQLLGHRKDLHSLLDDATPKLVVCELQDVALQLQRDR